jgi:hypothetical protein
LQIYVAERIVNSRLHDYRKKEDEL